MDCDKFKEINDENGHAVGDKVLKRIASAFEKYFGDDEHTYIFRIGGDEFTILIENYKEENDSELINKLNKMNDELSENIREIPGISLSIGIAHGSKDDTTDTLFKKADRALYEVKNHGRHGIIDVNQ